MIHMRYNLVAFDMDGTLILGKTCWGVIHEYFGVQSSANNNLIAWDRGQIDYLEFMRRDILLWQPVPTIKKIREILSSYTLAPNAREVVDEVRKKGYRTAIITGGLDLLAVMVADDLGIANVVANELETDGHGNLTGEGIIKVDPSRKDETLADLAEKLGVVPEECVAVGDSRYDVKFINRAGLGVSIGGDLELSQVADVVIRDFNHFPRLLDYL